MSTSPPATAPAADPAAERFLSTGKAAQVLGMSPSWLEHDRGKKHPEIPFVRMGQRNVRYRMSDLTAYAEKRLHGVPVAA